MSSLSGLAPAMRHRNQRGRGASKRSARLVLGLAVAAVFLAAIPAVASATIRVNQGMFGIKLGQSQYHVRHKLGRPDAVKSDRKLHEVDWFYDRGLFVAFNEKTKRVTGLLTDRGTERTSNGVGVGSTEAEVVAGVPGATCEADKGAARLCTVQGRHAVTSFGLDNGLTVSDVDISHK